MTARRRLSEEMGLVAILTEVFTFLYQADVGNGLTENEFDHVFSGYRIGNQALILLRYLIGVGLP